LRKRLYAIREKSNNKYQFNKIIEKIEARLAGINGATKNTIITPKPLANIGQIVMSYFCELPIAHVTIEKEQKCYYIKPVRETITIGDTTLLYVQKGDGAEIPAGERFDIELIGPEGDIGALKAIGGQPSSKLIGVIPPVIYIAPASISEESINVRFLVSKSGNGSASITSRPIKDSTKSTDNSKDLRIANNFYIQAMLNECPFVDLTVTGCPTIEDYIKSNYLDKGLPDPRKKAVTFDMFYVEQKNDNVACTEKKTRAGTTTVTLRPEYYEFNMKYLVYYVTDMCFNIEWGYCIENLKEMYGVGLRLFVEADIPQSEEMDKFDIAREMYQSLSKFKGPDESSQKIQGPISYYPVSEINIHEHVHIGQHVVKLMELYSTALAEINNLPSPQKDWCTLDIEAYNKLEEDQQTNFEKILKGVRTKWEKWKIEKEIENEREAYEAGFEEVKRLIEILKQRFPILKSIK
jgi:hypothetical protein